MAKLDSPPSPAIIGALKGLVDYACWKGIFYARSWPRKPGEPRAVKVQQQYAAYGYISQQAHTIDQPTTDAYRALSDGSLRTWRDWQISLYYGYDISLEPDPAIDKTFEPTAYDTWKSFT